jgi:hypothetical protein
MPDGSSVQIDNLPTTDPAGYAGLEDGVDYHVDRLAMGVVLSTLLGVGTELTLGDSESELVRALRDSLRGTVSRTGSRRTEAPSAEVGRRGRHVRSGNPQPGGHTMSVIGTFSPSRDGGLPGPITAALFPDDGGETANLVWSRKARG